MLYIILEAFEATSYKKKVTCSCTEHFCKQLGKGHWNLWIQVAEVDNYI